MTLKAILAGAAVLMVSGPALAQSTPPTAPAPPTAPGAPSTDQKPTPPADTPTATPPNNPDATPQPDTNNTATSPAAPDATTSPSSAAAYGQGWDEKRCADARRKGRPVDSSNCPAAPKPKS